MSIAYFRKSKYSFNETIENFKNEIKKGDWKLIGDFPIIDKQVQIISICKPEWVKELVEKDYKLLTLLPCTVIIFKKDNDTFIGTGQPTIIKALTKDEGISALASQAEEMIQDLIHKSAGIEKLKPSRIKLYSTMSCPYCKMEHTFLTQHNIEHEVTYVDLNPQEAENLVKKTGQMGVPVTEIQYDQADSEFIVGFDKERLSQILGIK